MRFLRREDDLSMTPLDGGGAGLTGLRHTGYDIWARSYTMSGTSSRIQFRAPARHARCADLLYRTHRPPPAARPAGARLQGPFAAAPARQRAGRMRERHHRRYREAL